MIRSINKEERQIDDKMEQKLRNLKGYSFDGDTGRTLKDLYKVVHNLGGEKDNPFVASFRIQGSDRPGAVNSYLDAGGKRFHIIWHSETSGLSKVTDVVFDAPSLAKVKSEEACGSCSTGMS